MLANYSYLYGLKDSMHIRDFHRVRQSIDLKTASIIAPTSTKSSTTETAFLQPWILLNRPKACAACPKFISPRCRQNAQISAFLYITCNIGAVYKVHHARGRSKKAWQFVTREGSRWCDDRHTHFIIHNYETWKWNWCLTFCWDGCILTDAVTSWPIKEIIRQHGILNLNYLQAWINPGLCGPTCGRAWWLSGKFGVLRPQGHRFVPHCSRHVGNLGKSFTRSCLYIVMWRPALWLN